MPMRALPLRRVVHGSGQCRGRGDAADSDDGRNETAVNIDVNTLEEADRVFAAMSAGGKIEMPLAESPWAQRFGMFSDRYGKPWMVRLRKRCAGLSALRPRRSRSFRQPSVLGLERPGLEGAIHTAAALALLRLAGACRLVARHELMLAVAD